MVPHSKSPQINYYKGESACTVERCGGYHFNQELKLSIEIVDNLTPNIVQYDVHNLGIILIKTFKY